MTLDGPPGLAFGAATGMAIAERLLAARFGRSLVDHRTWLVAGAAELSAGTAQEAAVVAGALQLGRLAVVAALPAPDPRLVARFSASGWNVRHLRGTDRALADAALAACLRSQKPTLILSDAPPAPPASQEPDAPTDANAGESERGAGRASAGARRAWLKRLRRHASREVFQHGITGHLPAGWPVSYTHLTLPTIYSV